MHTTPIIASEAKQPAPVQQPILPWLDLLGQLYPPRGVLLVGAGSGSSAWVQYLMAANWPNVTLIEADEATAHRLQAATQSQPSWQVLPHVIGPRTAPTPFYSASLDTESGLLEPESLRSLWPNLKTRQKQTRQAIALTVCLQDTESAANWLLVDCLPALPMVQGLAEQLEAFDVIAARVLLNAAALPDGGAGLPELQAHLSERGYRCLTTEAGRHPALGHTLFVRDTQALNLALREQHTLQQQTHAQACQQFKADLEIHKATQADKDALTKEKTILLAAKDAAEKAKTEALAALHDEQQARAQEKTELLKTLQDKLAHEHAWLAHSCIISDDLHQSVQKIIVSYKLSSKDMFDFLVELSDQISQSGDKVTALSYLNQARKAIAAPSREILTTFVKRLIKLERLNEAEAVFTQAVLDGTGILPLSDSEKSAIKKASQRIHQIVGQRSEHGHDLLLSAFNKHLPSITSQMSERKPVLIEIGTTHEDVPGQGSTRKLADYCKNHGIEFITVDMDPHNADMAQRMFSEMGAAGFQAIAMKGEDFLRHYEGALDFIFLDAYDFDHGNHSELRQSRYEKFLGSRIDETECHRMHLDCAQSVAKKLSPFGLVCFDDTWLEDGMWTAKGTLGMPFLLANGFELVEARNRAALLRRAPNFTGICSA